MNRKNMAWSKISGVCGIVTPFVAFSCILLAVSSYSEFSWVDNALSDLGVVYGAAANLFNAGLIISGVMGLVFSVGLFKWLGGGSSGRLGALIFASDTLALSAIGIFTEDFRPAHYYASVAFFVLYPVSMLFIAMTFWSRTEAKMSIFTILTAAIAALVWVAQFAVMPFPNVAIPETVSALSASTWLITTGFKMIREASRAKT